MLSKDKQEIVDSVWEYIRDMGERYKCIVEFMVDQIDQHGLIVMSIRDISKEVGIPAPSVRLVTRRLQDEGFIERVSKNQQGGGVYRLCL